MATTEKENSIFVKIKNIDEKIKDIVCGYIRRCQYLLPNNNPYYNIPSLVEHLCITYYWISEYFTDHGNSITVNEQKNIATNTDDYM